MIIANIYRLFSTFKKYFVLFIVEIILFVLSVYFYPTQPVKPDERNIVKGLPVMVEYNTEQSLPRIREGLDALFVSRTNPQLRWACGNNGIILHTKNGGKKWEEQYYGANIQLKAIFFIDDNTGWVCGDGAILHTDNGGSSWNIQNGNITKSLRSIYFLNHTTGWACGVLGEIWYTDNGGETWVPRTSGVEDTLTCIYFPVDQMNGWTCGSGGKILYTADGGKNWDKQISNTNIMFNSVFFLDNVSGWVCGENGIILKTSNGGENWNPQHSTTSERLSAVYFTAKETGWACGAGGIVLRTTDSGNTWQQRDTGTELFFNSLYFTRDAGTGWICGEDGSILHSYDQGASWYLETAGKITALNSIWSAPDSKTAWACGENGLVLNTRNLDQNWISQKSGTTKGLNAIYFTESMRRGWVCGNNGTILATKDSGKTWEPQESSTNAGLEALFFINDFQGWACGAGGVILRTQNGGEQWEKKYTTETAALYALYFPDDGQANTEGWACGANGTIVHTIDGGDTWEPQTSGVNETLYSIYFAADRKTGWACGEGGIILQTPDGGVLWFRRESGIQSTLYSIAFYKNDKQSGWACGSAGKILYTNDGGTTWNDRSPDKKGALYSISLAWDKKATALACGEFGTILITGKKGGSWSVLNQHSKWPSGWYIVFLILIFILPFILSYFPADPREKINSYLDSDRAIEYERDDCLDFKNTALKLSRFIRNQDTKPPISIAITGKWGKGKSSLMNLVKEDITQHNYHPVSFNAWYHQDQEQFLVALLKNIEKQAIPVWWQWEGFRIRIKIFIKRFRRMLPKILLFTVFFFFLTAIFYGTSTESSWKFNNELPFFEALITYILGGFKFIYNAFEYLIKEIPEAGILKLLPEWSTSFIIISLLLFLYYIGKSFKPFWAVLDNFFRGFKNWFGISRVQGDAGFRHRLAGHFEELIWAIQPRKLVIFIDDLDRCKSENVITVLEAVNFLNASGNCIVIMGFDKERVEESILPNNRKFDKDSKDNRSENNQTLSNEMKSYAKQYMQKITNIEIPVPAYPEKNGLQLLLPKQRKIILAKLKELRKKNRKKNILKVIRRIFLTTLYLLLSVIIITLGYNYGKKYPLGKSASTPAPTPAAAEIPQPAVVPVTGNTDYGSIQPPQTTPAALPAAKISENNFLFDITNYIIPIMVIFTGIITGIMLFRKRQVKRIQDPPLYKYAYSAWYHVIEKTYLSPRELKRFKNKSRYIATAYGQSFKNDTDEKYSMLPEDLIIAFSIKYYRKQEEMDITEGVDSFWSKDDDPDFYEKILAKHNEFCKKINDNKKADKQKEDKENILRNNKILKRNYKKQKKNRQGIKSRQNVINENKNCIRHKEQFIKEQFHVITAALDQIAGKQKAIFEKQKLITSDENYKTQYQEAVEKLQQEIKDTQEKIHACELEIKDANKAIKESGKKVKQAEKKIKKLSPETIDEAVNSALSIDEIKEYERNFINIARYVI